MPAPERAMRQTPLDTVEDDVESRRSGRRILPDRWRWVQKRLIRGSDGGLLERGRLEIARSTTRSTPGVDTSTALYVPFISIFLIRISLWLNDKQLCAPGRWVYAARAFP